LQFPWLDPQITLWDEFPAQISHCFLQHHTF
jgi:hypothetical protein